MIKDFIVAELKDIKEIGAEDGIICLFFLFLALFLYILICIPILPFYLLNEYSKRFFK